MITNTITFKAPKPIIDALKAEAKEKMTSLSQLIRAKLTAQTQYEDRRQAPRKRPK